MTVATAIQSFLSHCKFEKNLSSKTLKAYQIDLTQLMGFIKKASNIDEINNVSKNDLRDYIVSLASFKPKSIKRKLATAKALFNYLEFEDVIAVNPFRKMRLRIKEPQKLPNVLDIREVIALFKISYRTKHQVVNKSSYAFQQSLRDIAVLELLFNTGARVSEIANIRAEAVNLHTGSITIKGKGNKERILQICNKEALAVLKDYYNVFRQKITKANGWFFVNRLNDKLSDQSIRNMVKRIGKEAGISKCITPHVFRHSFATLLLEKDVDIKYIQSMLGHSSIVTTQIYTHVNKEKQRQILRSKHPRKDFSMGRVEAGVDGG